MPASSSSQIAAGPKIHQLWQAVILKPFKLQECILHFWKPLIFINLVSAGQDHSYVLNTRFWLQKRSTFHRACVIGVYILFSLTVLSENLYSHISHLNGFFPSWTEATCLFRFVLREKLYSHLSHLNGFVPPWTEPTCSLRSVLWEQLYFLR